MKYVFAVMLILLAVAAISASARLDKLEERIAHLEPHRHRPGALEQAGL